VICAKVGLHRQQQAIRVPPGSKAGAVHSSVAACRQSLMRPAHSMTPVAKPCQRVPGSKQRHPRFSHYPNTNSKADYVIPTIPTMTDSATAAAAPATFPPAGRRGIEPCKGLWTIPAGFMEIGESSAAGAARETQEEANAAVHILGPYAHWDIPVIGQVGVQHAASASG
jgi:hypothetical protein